MYLVSKDPLLARAVFAKSIKVLAWQPGAPNPGSTFFRKKPPDFLKFFGPVTALWVLQPSQIKHMFSAESLLARAVFTRSIRKHGWQPWSQNPGSTIFRKNVLIFEIHRTSETSMGSLSLRNHVYGLNKFLTSQSSVCKIN